MSDQTLHNSVAPPAETLLGVPEVVWLAEVSNMTIYRLIHAGELPAVRIGRHFAVPASAAQALRPRVTTANHHGEPQ